MPEESNVYNYGSNNFKQQIEELDGNFIMFYAPWYVKLDAKLELTTHFMHILI